MRFQALSDLSFLPLGFSPMYSKLFSASLKGGLNCFASTAAIEILGHAFEAGNASYSHPVLADCLEKAVRVCAETAGMYLKQLCKRIFVLFRDWLQFHWMVTKSTLASNESLALKVSPFLP